MEAAPFNIHVIHVSPGGVKTNIAGHALDELSLRDDSLYQPWLDAMVNSLNVSAGPLSLAADQLARKVVKQVLKPKPPRSMTLGAGAPRSTAGTRRTGPCADGACSPALR